LIEKAFGWMKQTSGIRKTKLRGLAKVAWQFLMTAAAFNLWRLPKLETPEVYLKRRKAVRHGSHTQCGALFA
jgi:hypothetical protein